MDLMWMQQMDSDGANSLASFGFLTVLEDSAHGLFGGYLVLNEYGRPREFHCSTPVKPTRAQQILYGPTLKPYLLGEVIGQSLVSQAKLAAQIVLTDLEDILSLALVHPGTIACVAEKATSVLGPTMPSETLLAAAGNEAELARLEEKSRPELLLGDYRLFGEPTCSWDDQQLQTMLAPLATHVDLAEPFERIREAIREAQRITHLPATDEHEQSAAA